MFSDIFIPDREKGSWLEVLSWESSESTTSESRFGKRFDYEAAAAYQR
ncbi:MAG: hypothetical protein IK109_11430 [Clostridiales bacterium]|nr:hypothetical protein [Clostridiales bacterium]